MTEETGVVELGGNFGIGVRLVRNRMGLHRLSYGEVPSLLADKHNACS